MWSIQEPSLWIGFTYTSHFKMFQAAALPAGIAAGLSFRGGAQESSEFHLQPSFNDPDDNETLRLDASDTLSIDSSLPLETTQTSGH